jgi:hypothetical protein
MTTSHSSAFAVTFFFRMATIFATKGQNLGNNKETKSTIGIFLVEIE